jgi:hypothetical protein
MESRSTVAPGRVQACRLGTRVIPAETDFVYVMRRDSDYVSAQLAERLGAQGELGRVTAAYDRAVDTIAASVLSAFRHERESPAVDLLDSREVHARRLELIAGIGPGTVVSMDPLMEDEGVLPLAFSRCYLPGGETFIEMIPRPGSPSLEDQVAAIATAANEGPLIVVEDDFFTGATISTMLGSHLGDLIDHVAGVVAGTKVGLLEPDFPVLPAVRYCCEDDSDPLRKVDLGDPRDYLIGASGLVCRLPSGRLGRLPYVLPFVSPAQRASIPAAAEQEFSAAAIGLSRRFYDELAAIVGHTITLTAADPAFAIACEELLGLAADTPIVDVLDATHPNGAGGMRVSPSTPGTSSAMSSTKHQDHFSPGSSERING